MEGPFNVIQDGIVPPVTLLTENGNFPSQQTVYPTTQDIISKRYGTWYLPEITRESEDGTGFQEAGVRFVPNSDATINSIPVGTM